MIWLGLGVALASPLAEAIAPISEDPDFVAEVQRALPAVDRSVLGAHSSDYRWLLQRVRAAGLPDVVAVLPASMTGMAPDFWDEQCRSGPWRLAPEASVRAARHTITLRVAGCELSTGELFSPRTPVPVSQPPYREDGRCILAVCRHDERSDLAKSSELAIADLREAWSELADLPDAPLLLLLASDLGFYDQRFGMPDSRNVLPTVRRWQAKGGKLSDQLPPGAIRRAAVHVAWHLVAQCETRGPAPWCES